MSLSYINQQINIYGGFFFITVGLIGNSINIFIFSTVRSYRTTPCTFYSLIGSIYNILYLSILATSRTVAGGYRIDLTLTSVVWCKARQFFNGYVSLTCFSCSCLATIDQFFVTSGNVYLRRYSNIKLSHRIVSIVIIIWFLHGIPCFFFYNISSISNKCVSSSAMYTTYVRIYISIYLSVLPILIIGIFGFLTSRNIRQTIGLVRQNADRQFTKMILLQLVIVFIGITPFGVYNAYSLITTAVVKDANGILKETLISTICSSFTNIYYAGNFYMFFISSVRFRQAVKKRIFLCWKLNHINPY